MKKIITIFTFVFCAVYSLSAQQEVNYEDQVKKLLALRFEFFGNELIKKQEEYISTHKWSSTNILTTLKACSINSPKDKDNGCVVELCIIGDSDSDVLNSFFGEASLPIRYSKISNVRPMYNGAPVVAFLPDAHAIHTYNKYKNDSAFRIIGSNTLGSGYCDSHPIHKIISNISNNVLLSRKGKTVKSFLINIDGYFNEQKLEWYMNTYTKFDSVQQSYAIYNQDPTLGIYYNNDQQYYFDLIKLANPEYYQAIEPLRQKYMQKHNPDECIECLQAGHTPSILALQHEADPEELALYLKKWGKYLQH